ncbi:hypothetical protein ACOJQI_11890 [Bacillus salacetis]|uniref:hypothetical protein n=1 Tax=Bacillus salacetis TaxID=2315464 RepID=UPI003B9FFAB4
MDKQRTLFYGFIVGFAMLVLPIPNFFFFNGVIEDIGILFDYIGFALFVVCGISLIIKVAQSFLT